MLTSSTPRGMGPLRSPCAVAERRLPLLSMDTKLVPPRACLARSRGAWSSFGDPNQGTASSPRCRFCLLGDPRLLCARRRASCRNCTIFRACKAFDRPHKYRANTGGSTAASSSPQPSDNARASCLDLSRLQPRDDNICSHRLRIARGWHSGFTIVASSKRTKRKVSPFEPELPCLRWSFACLASRSSLTLD